MAYITKYGSFWGMLPQTAGRIFWVADAATYTIEGTDYSASDDNDGLSPERAFRTVDYAVGRTTANEGDVIVLLHGSHSVSATIAVDVAGITITGLPSGIPLSRSRASSGGKVNRTQITTTQASGIIFTVTGADVELAYMHLVNITAGTGISVSNAADRFYAHDLTFANTAAESATSYNINFPLGTGTTTRNDNSLIRNCYVYNEGNNGPAIRAVGTVRGLVIESCTFELAGATAWDDAIEVTLQGSQGIIIRDCDFVTISSATATFTDCIDATGVTDDNSITVLRCYFPVGSDALEGSAVGDFQCAENYLMQGAASVGGTLVLST